MPHQLQSLAWAIGRVFYEQTPPQIEESLRALRLQIAHHQQNIEQLDGTLRQAMRDHLECLTIQRQMREDLHALNLERQGLATLALHLQNQADAGVVRTKGRLRKVP